MNKVFLGTDHAGFELKNAIKKYLQDKNEFEIIDCGADKYDAEDDYPDFIKCVGEEINKNREAIGIILGGSGQGEAIVANRFNGVRAIVYNTDNIEIIKVAREHNDANVLSIGARFISEESAVLAVQAFLDSPFSEDERHKRRIKKTDNL